MEREMSSPFAMLAPSCDQVAGQNRMDLHLAQFVLAVDSVAVESMLVDAIMTFQCLEILIARQANPVIMHLLIPAPEAVERDLGHVPSVTNNGRVAIGGTSPPGAVFGFRIIRILLEPSRHFQKGAWRWGPH